jgi:acyl-CoA reductase-like NAD-dependent aldehyde dehydrogenase
VSRWLLCILLTLAQGRAIPCYNPGNGELLGEDISATPQEVNDAVRRAAIAQKDWGKTSFEERAAFLYDLLQAVLEHQEEICRLSVLDTGKTSM